MLIQPVDYFLVVWFALAAASTAYVAWDQYRNNPEPAVLKWGFIWSLSIWDVRAPALRDGGQRARPGEHETFISPLWKQGVGRRFIVSQATRPESFSPRRPRAPRSAIVARPDRGVRGRVCLGLFIFQSLFMKSMMGGRYRDNVRQVLPAPNHQHELHDVGMGPIMKPADDGTRHAGDGAPSSCSGLMSLGVIAGFTTAYPANVWLVARH